MATTTFGTPCPVGEWTVIADGATIAGAGIQIVGVSACRIAIAASAPALASDEFFLLYPGNIDEQVTPLTLGAGNILYGQGLGATAYVRGYLTAS